LCKKYTWTSSEKPNQTCSIAGLRLSKQQRLTKIIEQTVKFVVRGIKFFGTGALHFIKRNNQHGATIFQFIILTFACNSTCFGCFPAHHQELNDCSGSLLFYLRIVVTVVLCSGSGRPAGRPDHEHSTAITTIRR
jgi:type III secretory pathway component EscS